MHKDSLTVTPLADAPFGCSIELPSYCNNDPSTLNDDDFAKLDDAVQRHFVVLIPNQVELSRSLNIC